MTANSIRFTLDNSSSHTTSAIYWKWQQNTEIDSKNTTEPLITAIYRKSQQYANQFPREMSPWLPPSVGNRSSMQINSPEKWAPDYRHQLKIATTCKSNPQNKMSPSSTPSLESQAQKMTFISAIYWQPVAKRRPNPNRGLGNLARATYWEWPIQSTKSTSSSMLSWPQRWIESNFWPDNPRYANERLIEIQTAMINAT